MSQDVVKFSSRIAQVPLFIIVSNMFYKIDQTILLAQLLVGIKVYMCTVVD